MKNIFIIILGLAVALFSCDQENMGTLYEPESPYVSFSSSVVSGNVLSTENGFSVNVQLVRSDLSTAASAEVALEMNEDIEGVFDLESTTVSFEEGKGKAYVKIVPTVDPSSIDPTKTYVFNLTITSENASELYNTTTYKASFKYTPIGTGNFQSEFFETSWAVEIEKLEVGNKVLYKAKNLYETGYNITIVTEGENVTVNLQTAWYHGDYGDIYVAGSGTVSGKVITMVLDHHVPELGSFGEYTEVLTLP